MRSGFRIGRIAGINIFVDWSWLFIFLLVAWNLAVGVFPPLHPNWSMGLDVGLAVVAALLFFASVLAHELAHSIVAKSRGLPVHNITLFLFGGVSNIEREPQSPGVEFVMAIVGPLTSIVLGIIFILLARGLANGLGDLTGGPVRSLARLGPVATMLLWLGPINLILGIFNLIPGFPLDGGRVLRSILWAATHNLRRATFWATWVGRIVAWAFIVAGVAMIFGVNIPLLGGGFISGLWLAFIGWFLSSAATSSYQQVVVHDLLEGVPVAKLMRNDVHVVPPDASVADLTYRWIMGTDERAFPVMENDCLVGLVCLEDVRKVPREQWDTTRVRDIMTPTDQLATVTPGEDAGEALDELARRDVRQVPVVENCRVVGLLRRRDIMRWLQVQSGRGGARSD